MGLSKLTTGLVTFLTPSEALIDENIPTLRRALEECRTRQELRVVIDLHAVPVADSSGLEFLLEAQQDLQSRGGSLKLANPNPLLNEILVATRLNRELEIFFDLDRAGRSFI